LFERATIADPRDAFSEFNLGLLLGLEGHRPGAEAALRRSATLSPSRMPSRTLLEVYVAIASLREWDSDLSGAELELKKALSLYPQDPVATTNLAIVLADEGDQMRGQEASKKSNQAEALFRA